MTIGCRPFTTARCRRWACGAAIAACAFALPPAPISGQEGTRIVPPAIGSIEKTTGRTKQAGGAADEGIAVHGHWTIEVLNPDGSTASRTEFQNALASLSGPSMLSLLLARQAAPGFWFLHLYEGNGNGIGPCENAGVAAPCSIHEPNTITSGAHARTLLLESPTSGPNAGSVVLTGSVTAQRTASIDGVVTQASRCPASNTPSTPCNGPLLTFTVGNPPAVAVVPGQIVQVTVVLSFS